MERPTTFVASAALLALMTLMMLPYQAAAATTWHVDGTLGNDANSCTSPGLGNACQTIQATINKASSGDTISVAAGTYPELAPGPLAVNKQLTLLGAQAGVDARTRAGPESIVSDTQGTSVSASGVIIDGFTVANSINPAFTGFGIWLNPGVSGTRVLNNIIENNIVGIALANVGAQAVIRRNLIRNNNVPGPATGQGIYTDQFVGGPTVAHVLIHENAFIGNSVAGIDISNTDPSGGAFDLEVATNSFSANGRALLLFNTHNSTFHHNGITGSTAATSAAIRLLDNNSALSFTFNDLSLGSGHAIRVSLLGAVGSASSGVVFHQNNIGTLGPASFALTGLTVDPGSHLGTLDAECNWWGSNTGPTNANNPGGIGEEVVGDADFTPWLVAPAPGGACAGGAPTPGKVTGGGQTDGDPIFSPVGDLLSLPALIPSLADPSAQSTFGFVAKCCPPTGNFEFKDHQASVRIKAQSIGGLSISSPGTSCPATPGSKHATFFGMAAVTRPAGTTNEEFAVDVDDCGEPGTNDTFGITTETYSNPPSKLIGGNIQIR